MYNFVSLIVKIILSALLLSAFWLAATDKTQYFVEINFSSTLQLINSIFEWSPEIT